MRRRREDEMDSVQVPEEIMEEILVKLPVKSIVRFRCVCKLWFNLIKGSRFVHKHLIESDESFPALCFFLVQGNNRLCKRRYSAVFRYDDDEEEKTSATRFYESVTRLINRGQDDDDSDEQQGVDDYIMLPMFGFKLPSSYSGAFPDLVGHCNGILCFSEHRSILLVNPSLKEMKTFPIPLLDNRLEYCELVGFGFDNMTMDFKVVTILSFKHQYNGGVVGQRAHVYSLRSHAWRQLNVCPNNYTSFCPSVFFDGAVHWCTTTRQHSGSDWRMLTFNMITELFEEIKLPQDFYNAKDVVHSLIVLNQDSLAFVLYPACPFNSSTDFVNVWTMNHKHETDGWTKLYSIGHLNQFLKPICFWKKHKLFYITTTRKLILYDLLNRNSIVLWDDVSPFRKYNEHGLKINLEVGICKSSLISINT